MSDTVGCQKLLRLILALFAIATVNAYAQATAHFDLPAQPLADSLKAIANQTSTNVLFDLRLVEGMQARPLKADLTAEGAIERLLTGTGIRHELVNEHTIVLATTKPTAVAASNPASIRLASNSSAAAGTADPKPAADFWHGLHLSQATEPAAAAPGQSESQQSEAQLQEVIVTAQKRSERLQDVPISISVLGGKELDSSRFEGMTEALSAVPGVAVTPAFQGGGTQVTVRGVSAAGPLFGGASPIGYYLDSVPFGLIHTSIAPDESAYDLQRVEVLRGPQGTLYGASAENGLVRVLTNDANLNDFELKVRTSASGTDGGGANYRGDMAINVPLIEGKLAARAVVGYENLSGWIDTPVKDRTNDAQLRNYRLKINAQPTDDLSIGLSAWKSRDDYGAPSTGRRDESNTSIIGQPMSTGFDAYSLKVGYQFPWFSISSATSYLDYTNRGYLDLAPLVNIPFALYTGLASNVFSQEVNLTSRNDAGWRWAVGGIYRRVTDVTIQQDYPAPNPYNDHQLSKSDAVFGELTKLLLDGRLELTGGLRHFHDDASDNTEVFTPGAPPVIKNATFDATTPRVVLTWHSSERATFYASFSEGFRSGILQGPPVPASFPPTQPDKLKNYEVGAKGNLLDGRLSYESAVYYMDWVGVQQQLTLIGVNNIPFSAVVNGKSASGMGVDFSLAAHPIDALTLRASVSWNNLEMDSQVISGGAILYDKGSRLDFSPEYTGSVSADYAFPLGSGGVKGKLSISAAYTSVQTDRLLVGDSVNVGTGDPMWVGRTSLAFDFPNRLSGTLYIDNFTNDRGSPIASPYAVSGDWDVRLRPRTVGAQLEYRF